MGSDDGGLEGGVMSPAEGVGDAPMVSAWIRRRDGHPLAFGTSDEVSFDAADLARLAQWTPQIEVVGDIGQEPGLGPKWQRIRTDGARLVFAPPRGQRLATNRLVVRLLGLDVRKPLKATVTADLAIGDHSYQLRLAIDLSAAPPRITMFRARPSVVVTGGQVTFELQCQRASSWRIADAAADQTVASATRLDPRTTISEHPTRTMQTSGLAGYRLIATNEGRAEETASVLVKVVDRSGWISAGRWWEQGHVEGLCVSPRGESVYALVRSEDGAASVWWSADGFGRWEELADALPDMVTSPPGVCFRMESGTRLVFAGGSKIDPTRASSTVWMLDVHTRQWSSSEGGWEPRMGHACVVARDRDGAEKLWLIGGVDRNGNALDDIQVSADGRTWERRAGPGWAARCMFGAAVKGSEIWVGGGFEEPDGKAVSDIWTWDPRTPAAQALKTGAGVELRVTDGEWDLSAFALAVLDEHVYVAGVERRVDPAPTTYQAIFDRLRADRGGYVRPARISRPDWSLEVEDARLEAVAFNGCIWLFAQRHVGAHRIESSGLHYYVPGPDR